MIIFFTLLLLPVREASAFFSVGPNRVRLLRDGREAYPAMLAEINRRSFTFRNSKTRVERAMLGNQAGLYGAAFLPFQR